jgi:8-oxo-dGTP pyrophosphatase MutT (NUDIX family)
MRARRLPHRASYIVLEDKSGRFYVEKRTLTKDYCPGMLDACIGGVVTAEDGDDIAGSAGRELREELGVRTDLVWLGWLRIDVQESFVYGGLFYGRYDGAVTMQPEEVSDVIMLTEDEMLARAAEATPDSVIAFREILRRFRTRE